MAHTFSSHSEQDKRLYLPNMLGIPWFITNTAHCYAVKGPAHRLGMTPGWIVELMGMHSSLPQQWQHSGISTCSPGRQLSMEKHKHSI